MRVSGRNCFGGVRSLMAIVPKKLTPEDRFEAVAVKTIPVEPPLIMTRARETIRDFGHFVVYNNEVQQYRTIKRYKLSQFAC